MNLSFPFPLCQPSLLPLELSKPVMETSFSSTGGTSCTIDNATAVVSPSSCASSQQQHKKVTFSTVHIREYPIALAPGMRGPAIELAGWDCYRDRPVVWLQDDDNDDTAVVFPEQQQKRRHARHLFQPVPVRVARLQQLQYTRTEILQACYLSQQQQQQQQQSTELLSPVAWIRREVKALRRSTRLQRAVYRLQHDDEGYYDWSSSSNRIATDATTSTMRANDDDDDVAASTALHRRLYACWPGSWGCTQKR